MGILKASSLPGVKELKDSDGKKFLQQALEAGRKAVQESVAERKKAQEASVKFSSFRF